MKKVETIVQKKIIDLILATIGMNWNIFFNKNSTKNTAYYLWFWFQGQFEEMKLEDGGELYSHFTCATDTENIRLVFFMVEQRIVKKIMEEFAMNWRWRGTYFSLALYSDASNIIFLILI